MRWNSTNYLLGLLIISCIHIREPNENPKPNIGYNLVLSFNQSKAAAASNSPWPLSHSITFSNNLKLTFITANPFLEKYCTLIELFCYSLFLHIEVDVKLLQQRSKFWIFVILASNLPAGPGMKSLNFSVSYLIKLLFKKSRFISRFYDKYFLTLTKRELN